MSNRHVPILASALFISVITFQGISEAMQRADNPLFLEQNKILKEADAEEYWYAAAEDYACFRGLSYWISGKIVATLGPRIIPILYNSLKDEEYYKNYGLTTDGATGMAYHAGGEGAYRYCVWLIATRELAAYVQDDLRESFIDHLSGIVGTPRPWYEGDGPRDYILFETMETLGAFPSDKTYETFANVMRDPDRREEVRVYAAGFLINCNIPVISNEAKRFILSEYELDKSITMIAPLWKAGDIQIRKELVEKLKSYPHCDLLTFMFDIHESEPLATKDLLMAYLEKNLSGESLVPSYYPLFALEFLLEHYLTEELGLVWIKERCLAHGGLKFLGYAYEYEKPIALRWQLLRKKLFPELDEIELQTMTEENVKELRKQWEPFVVRVPWRIVYTMDKETGEVVLGAGKE